MRMFEEHKNDEHMEIVLERGGLRLVKKEDSDNWHLSWNDRPRKMQEWHYPYYYYYYSNCQICTSTLTYIPTICCNACIIIEYTFKTNNKLYSAYIVRIDGSEEKLIMKH